MKSVRRSEILAAVQRAVIQTLSPKDTGLPMTVFPLTHSANPYMPRIKVPREHGQQLSLDKMLSVSISDNPEIVGEGHLAEQDLRFVRAWVLLNKDTLLRYWNHGITYAEMAAALRPLGRPNGRK